jgi:hypothetical protein
VPETLQVTHLVSFFESLALFIVSHFPELQVSNFMFQAEVPAWE